VPDEWRAHRARLAALSRHYPDHPEMYAAERRALKVKHAEDYIGRLLTEPPELMLADREHLASLLLGGVDAAD